MFIFMHSFTYSKAAARCRTMSSLCLKLGLCRMLFNLAVALNVDIDYFRVAGVHRPALGDRNVYPFLFVANGLSL